MIEQSLRPFFNGKCTLNSEDHKNLLSLLSLSKDGVKKTIVIYKPSTEYHCYYEEGIALCFENKQLDSIDFYRPTDGSSKSKYKPVIDSRVPSEIGPSSTALQLVEKYGEPLEKGGGMTAKIDIWLRWKGFQVEIPSRDWDAAKDTQWSSFTMFKD